MQEAKKESMDVTEQWGSNVDPDCLGSSVSTCESNLLNINLEH